MPFDYTGWSPENQATQEAIFQAVADDLRALLAVGVELETAKRLANWNETIDYDFREALFIKFSRSAARTNPGNLEGAQLDSGVSYAIFIPDIPELGITSVSWLLDGSPVHVEVSAPWDYDGTNFDGSANRVTFTSGEYTIQADINDATGSFSIDATFNVE